MQGSPFRLNDKLQVRYAPRVKKLDKLFDDEDDEDEVSNAQSGEWHDATVT